jgi:glycosyltransferase involved in cell wall biosynthesis
MVDEQLPPASSPPARPPAARALAPRLAIILPVYNHARTICSVIEDLQEALRPSEGIPDEQLPIIVVDDGSTDGLRPALAGLPHLTLLRHTRNLGKGAALLTGFRHARSAGFTHAITVDADGQHAAADVIRTIEETRRHPDDLVIGQRDMEHAAVPLRSRRGRDAARYWLRVQTGLDIRDTQCGLRGYPLAETLALPHRFTRYDFETEILARLAWAGVGIRSLPIRCIYFPPARRISHFRPLLDTLRGIRVNAFLVVRRLLPLPLRRLRAREDDAVAFGSWWRWSTWRNAVRDALRAGSSNSELAMAFAMGIFIGLTPFYMLQTVLAIYFARRLHLNVLTAVLGSQISIPPLAPVWVALSLAVGHLMVGGEWVLADIWARSAAWDFHTLSLRGLWTFLLGNFLVALTAAFLSLLAARLVLYCVRSQPVASR